MTTAHSKKPTSHVTHAQSPPQAEATAPAAPVVAPPAANVHPVIFLSAPPPGAKIPSPPAGFSPPVGGIYRGVLPRKTELAALAGAVEELGSFADYAVLLGATAPEAAQVAQALDIGGQWSSMRSASDFWDGFCRAQEGIAWMTIRAMLDRLRPAFDLAVAGDPAVATSHPNLAALLGAKKMSAKQSATTKRLNKQAVAEGKPPTHGRVGKQRQRAAEKQAAATLVAAPTTTPAAPAPAPVTTTTTPPGAAHS